MNINNITEYRASFLNLIQSYFFKDKEDYIYPLDTNTFPNNNDIIYAFNCSSLQIFLDTVNEYIGFSWKELSNRKIIIVADNIQINSLKELSNNPLFEILSLDQVQNIDINTLFYFYPFRNYLAYKAPNEELKKEQVENLYKVINCKANNLALIFSDKEWWYFFNKLKNLNTEYLILQATKDSLGRYLQKNGLSKLSIELHNELLINKFETNLQELNINNIFINILEAYYNNLFTKLDFLELAIKYELNLKITDQGFEAHLNNFNIDEKIILKAFWSTLKENYIEAYGLWKELEQEFICEYILNLLVKKDYILDILIATNDSLKVMERYNDLSESEIKYLKVLEEIVKNDFISSSNELLNKFILNKINDLQREVVSYLQNNKNIGNNESI